MGQHDTLLILKWPGPDPHVQLHIPAACLMPVWDHVMSQFHLLTNPTENQEAKSQKSRQFLAGLVIQ